jgi:hypothetical protein
MSMEHKAFVFDHDRFHAELHDALVGALRTEDITPLRDFIEKHRDELTDPYEGAPLDDDWESQVAPKDPHQYGDFALTKYYDPSNDIGLGYEWQELEELLTREAVGGALLLGSPIDSFDPGKQGSYVQSPDMVHSGLTRLDELLGRKPDLAGQLAAVRTMLESAASRGLGLYITF